MNYNAKGEVVTANHSTNNAFDRSYEFDGIGNRKKSVDGLDLVDPTATSYTSNALNQYQSILKNSGNSVRTHDLDGNIVEVGAGEFTWDAENRLVEIKDKSDNSTIATYQYDFQSRRISKTVGNNVTSFVYDGWNPIAEYTSPLHTSNFTLHTSFTWGADLSESMQGAGGVGGLLSVNDGSNTYYPTFDGNGNVSEYVDATGVVVAHYEYDAFGRAVASGVKANDFTHQFSTKQLNAESGLHYYGFRYYDAGNGRWLGRDPIQENGGLNLYGFVGNDVASSIDALGLKAWMRCTRCKGTKGPMRCVVYDSESGVKLEPFTTNEDENLSATPKGKWKLLPKPDSQMDPENQGLGRQNIANGKVNEPNGKPEFPVGTPSLTGPGMQPGQPKPDWNPTVRIHGRGTSKGCITTDKCGEIQRIMEDNQQDGGMTVEVEEVCCKDGELPENPSPKAIIVNE